MFRERIENPIDPIPKVYADKLKRITNEPDYSLTCLGIAMLKSRIEDYNGITGVYYNAEDKASCFQDFEARVSAIDTYPLYCYYTYTKGEVDEEYIEEHFKNFNKKDSIAAFIKEKAECDCLVLYHETMNAVGIFINSRDFRLYHLLQSFMSLYYPAIFEDKPMKEDDYNLIKSLSKKEKQPFFDCIRNMVNPYIMEFRRMQLSILMKGIHERKIADALGAVEAQRVSVTELEAELSRRIIQLKEFIVTYEGLKATENYDSAEEELVEYLSKNNAVHNLDIVDQSLYFSVATTLNNYNEEAWRLFSERGHIYDGDYRTNLPEIFKIKENRKKLLDNIFSEDPQLIVKIAGNYRIDLNGCRLYTDRHYPYVEKDPIFKSYLPNPHLKLFECLGGYRDRIMPILRNRDYITAIEMCIASAGSVDLDETEQTFRPFLGWILSSTEKILKTKDGTEMTPEEALVWLLDKEKENETN
jgi:hypothetical protein